MHLNHPYAVEVVGDICAFCLLSFPVLFFFFFPKNAFSWGFCVIVLHPSPFLLLASHSAMAPGQIGFQNLLSDRSFSFQITATPQKTLLLEFLVPAEGSTCLRWETCNSCHVVLACLNIRVLLLSLLWGGNDSYCISGLPIYQRLSPWRSEALRRSVLCVSLSFNHCSRHSPTTERNPVWCFASWWCGHPFFTHLVYWEPFSVKMEM